MNTIQKEYYRILDCNTLHGFNTATTDGFIIGLVGIRHPDPAQNWGHAFREFEKEEYSEYSQKVSEIVGIPSIVNFTFNYAGDFVTIPMQYRNKIPEVINAILSLDCYVKLQTSLEPFYMKGMTFSIEQSEMLAYPSVEYYLSGSPDNFKRNWIDPRLWKTHRGKELASAMLQKYNKYVSEIIAANPGIDLKSRFMLPKKLYLAPETLPESEKNAEIDYPMVDPGDSLNSCRAAFKVSCGAALKEHFDLFLETVPKNYYCKCNSVSNTMVFPCKHIGYCQDCLGTNFKTDTNFCLRCNERIQRYYLILKC